MDREASKCQELTGTTTRKTFSLKYRTQSYLNKTKFMYVAALFKIFFKKGWHVKDTNSFSSQSGKKLKSAAKHEGKRRFLLDEKTFVRTLE